MALCFSSFREVVIYCGASREIYTYTPPWSRIGGRTAGRHLLAYRQTSLFFSGKARYCPFGKAPSTSAQHINPPPVPANMTPKVAPSHGGKKARGGEQPVGEECSPLSASYRQGEMIKMMVSWERKAGSPNASVWGSLIAHETRS